MAEKGTLILSTKTLKESYQSGQRDFRGLRLEGGFTNSFYKSQFSDADFRDAYLQRVNFRDADLSRTDFRNANLSKAFFHLETGANLRYANLEGADLSGAFIDSSDLSHSNLIGANLHSAHIWGANFTGARLFHGNVISDERCLELSTCNGLGYAKFDDDNFAHKCISRAFVYAVRPDVTQTSPPFLNLCLKS